MSVTRYLGVVVAVFAACEPTSEDVEKSTQEVQAGDCSTGQIFGTAQHDGVTCAPVDRPNLIGKISLFNDFRGENVAWRFVLDRGFFAFRHSAVLTNKEWFYTVTDTGFSGSTLDRSPEHYTLQAYQWVNHVPTLRWTQPTEWQPIDAFGAQAVFGLTFGYTTMIQPALQGTTVLLPGLGGEVARLDQKTGQRLSQISPMRGTIYERNPRAHLGGPITIDEDGNAWFFIVAWSQFLDTHEPDESWLVKVTPQDVVTLTPWTTVAPLMIGDKHIEDRDDLCPYSFDFADPPVALPYPPSPDAVAPQFLCDKQRPLINSSPVITRDGKVVVLSQGHSAYVNTWMIALDKHTLRPVWASSFRHHIHDGCGDLIPFSDEPGGDECRDPNICVCRTGAHFGVNPEYNEEFSEFDDGGLMAKGIVVDPANNLMVGTYNRAYNGDGGHMFQFGPTGDFLGLFRYGWEQTPAIWRHDGSWSVLINDSTIVDGTLPGTFRTDILSPDLQKIEASTQVPEVPGFAASQNWQDGQPLVDSQGNSWHAKGQGHIYELDRNGKVIADLDTGAPGEALASHSTFGTDDDGKPVVYMPMNGWLWIIGTDRPIPAPVRADPAPASMTMHAPHTGDAIGVRPLPAIPLAR